MKFLKKLFALAFLVTAISSCGGGSSEPLPNTSVEDPTTVEPTTSVVDPTTSIDPTTSEGPGEWIDYVHDDERARLKLDYKDENGESRDFFVDGIGQVELRNCIDGDTAHFNPVNTTSGSYVKGRFYGIDTPESTGQIQLWGKSASLFTRSKLEAARDNGTIVISSPAQTYEKPQLDSTGSRYLSVVWIHETKKNAPFDELVCLNLWVVQEGYSATKSVDKIPEYKDVFFDADAQAQRFELHIWSDDIDPNWNYGDYEPASIIEIKDEERWSKEKGYENPFYDAKVHIEATVMGYSDHIVYVQEYYDYDWLETYLNECLDEGKIDQHEYVTRLEEGKNGVYAGIGLFTGMAFSNDTKYTTPNTRISANGSVGYQFGLQIQGISFPNLYSGGTTEVQILHTAKEVLENEEFADFRVHEFDVNSTDLKHDDTYMFMKVNVMDTLKVVGGKDDVEDGTIRLDVKTLENQELEFSININFPFYPLPENPRKRWKSYEYFVGHEIKVQGIYYFFTYTSGDYSVDYYNVLPTGRDDIQILTEIV